MFWERLYNLCEKNHCKPNTVVKAIGLSTAIATKWKNGTVPSGEVLLKIADYFNCSVDYLLGRQESNEQNDVYNDEEKNLIAMYRSLNEEGQEYVIKQFQFALSQPEYKKHNQIQKNA